MQSQIEELKGTIEELEVQQFESRNFELQMAQITSSLEKERDMLQREVLKYVGVDVSFDAVNNLKQEIGELKKKNEELKNNLIVANRTFEDKLEAERLLCEGQKKEADYLRSVMGDGINEIRVKMESGLQMALSRVDQMETLLWQVRRKRRSATKPMLRKTKIVKTF